TRAWLRLGEGAADSAGGASAAIAAVAMACWMNSRRARCMAPSAQRFAARVAGVWLHGVEVPLRLDEGTPGLRVLRIPADLVLAVDDLAATLDHVGDDAPVDRVAVPGRGAGLLDHRILHLHR